MHRKCVRVHPRDVCADDLPPEPGPDNSSTIMLGPGNSLLTSKLLNDFRSSTRASMQPLRAPADPAADIYRLLDNYAADISKAGKRGFIGRFPVSCIRIPTSSRCAAVTPGETGQSPVMQGLVRSLYAVLVVEAEIKVLTQQREEIDEARRRNAVLARVLRLHSSHTGAEAHLAAPNTMLMPSTLWLHRAADDTDTTKNLCDELL